jgi:hypothetical protein
MAQTKGSKGKGGSKTAKSFSVVLDTPQAKKSVVRYDHNGGEDDPLMTAGYFDKDKIAALGDPAKIKVTVTVEAV